MSTADRRDILRFTTAGSVDDGKSTLIGRLLLESKSIYQDQIEAVEAQSKRRGDPYLDLALFTDGLKAEREQKITIDVAYRYFSTPKRKFIIADCPGHIQYTRNMVTGASTAELAVVLVDARKGLVTQSKRHAFISTLLDIPHIVVAINKMDLVDFSEARYQEICDEFRTFASRLQVKGLTFIPVSALHGDNVVDKSGAMPWYQGSTFLHFLETVNTGAALNLIDFRFPVQYVLRPNQDFRGLAGRIASGRVAVGDDVVALPSGASSKIAVIQVASTEVEEAFVGDSVVIRLSDEIDVSRGDLLQVLSAQDAIADNAEDLGVLISMRKMEPVPDEVAELLLRLVHKCIQVVRQSTEVVDYLGTLVHSSFAGPEAQKVLELIDDLDREEHEADKIQDQLAKAFFRNEDHFKPAAIFLWMKIFNKVGDLANFAEKMTHRVRLFMAK